MKKFKNIVLSILIFAPFLCGGGWLLGFFGPRLEFHTAYTIDVNSGKKVYYVKTYIFYNSNIIHSDYQNIVGDSNLVVYKIGQEEILEKYKKLLK